MKQRLMFCAVLCLAMAACGQKVKVEKDVTIQDQTAAVENMDSVEMKMDYSDAYKGLLDHTFEIIANYSDDYDARDGETGLLEAVNYSDGDALKSIGYVMQDLNADGKPELLIGSVAAEDDEISRGNMIYAAYTIVDDLPKLIFEGMSRNSYRYLGDGVFLNQGSNGAIYSIFGTYKLSPNGTTLLCKDYYFTFEKDESFSSIGFYHNTTGKWDKSVSEELQITDEAFEDIKLSLANKAQDIAFIPFSKYTSSESHKLDGSPVYGDWAENVNLSEYDEYVATTNESQAKVVFSTRSTVTDFKFLALSDADFKDGKMSYKTETVYEQKQLTPERSLMVTMTFYGDIPNNGISYIDGNGKTRRFAVSASGNDGSVQLTEF